MEVGIWIRVSTEDQAKGESPQNHEKRARMYAELKGWRVIELYDLGGVSGKSVIDHPEAQRMLQDIASGKIQSLIFSKLARLARNVKELLDISDHFRKHKANLISLEESIDTSSPAGRLLFTVIGALAQWEREEISARVAASIPVRAKQGKPTGGSGPFGYQWVDRKLTVETKEAPVVREIFETFLEKKKLQTTARLINERGFRTRKGAHFGKTTIKRILTDPVYKGKKRANYSSSKGDKKSWALKPKEEWIFFNVDPIISEDTWDEVNAIIVQIEKRYPSEPLFIGKYAFSGLVKCECGRKMYVSKYDGMKVPRYRCRNCWNKINEDILFDQFKEGLRCMVVNPDVLQDSVKSDENTIQQKENQLITLQTELKNVEKKIDSLFDLWNDGAIDKRNFSERFDSLKEHKNQLNQEIPRLQGEIDFLKVSEVGKDYLLSKATTLHALWKDFDEESKVKVIRELLSGVTVTKSELILELFYLPSFMKLGKSDQNPRGSLPQQA